MNIVSKALLPIILTLSVNLFSDDHLSQPPGAAVEIFQCNFADGKGLEDSRKVSAKWDKWSDTNYSVPYAGYLMTPFYQTKSDFSYDIFWLGVAENFESLGIAQDEWAAKGGRLQGEFNAVSPCDNHAALYSFAVRRPKEPTPNGYLTIRGCNNKEGSTQAKFLAANTKLNDYLDSIGVDAGIFYWFPGAGSGIEQPYDYLEVMGHSSMKEWGMMPDNFIAGNPGPTDLDELRDCDTARVYSIEYVGGKTQN